MSSPSAPSPAIASRRVAMTGLLLALAILAAYLTSFGGAMVMDDIKAIVENPTLSDSRPLGAILNPGDAGGGTVGGRPLVNLTLALNHAVNGIDPWGYHAVNLAIHIAAALVLFGIVRRTLGLGRSLLAGDSPAPPPAAESPASRLLHSNSVWPPFTIAALWALHPLQTESVTYIIQRAESLCGLFYLLTVYAFVRAVEGALRPDRSCASSGPEAPPAVGASRPWLTAAFLCCLLGMATKEVMATAPLVVLLYDRTFVAGSWREAWRQRGGFHASLMGTWLLLAVLVAGTANRGGTAGFGTAITGWQYALTQIHAVPHYLRLAVWPQPLAFDYGTPLYPLSSVWPEALVLLLLLAATGWALARKPVVGFLGAVFFLVLAPSSSVVPVATQTIAEHRMYLPLAAVITVLVLTLRKVAGSRSLFVLLAVAAWAGMLTARRNLVYRSEFTLWEDTVVHCPENPRAHLNLGIALTLAGRLPEAEAQFREALRLDPTDAAIPLNLCNVLGQQGRLAEAVSFGESAVRLDPASLPARVNLAYTLEQLGRAEDAVVHYERARQLDPDAPTVAPRLTALLAKLGSQSAIAGDFAAAIARYRRALAISPEYVPARASLGNALLASGRVDEAIAEYQAVLSRNPDDRRVQENLTRALTMRNSGVR